MTYREDHFDLGRLYQPEPQDGFDADDLAAYEAQFDPGEYDPSDDGEGDGRQDDWQAEADFNFEPWE